MASGVSRKPGNPGSAPKPIEHERLPRRQRRMSGKKFDHQIAAEARAGRDAYAEENELHLEAFRPAQGRDWSNNHAQSRHGMRLDDIHP